MLLKTLRFLGLLRSPVEVKRGRGLVRVVKITRLNKEKFKKKKWERRGKRGKKTRVNISRGGLLGA
jgi:hypothetical protein